MERLLLHEIGHYVNETLVLNKTARYKSENSADNYAFKKNIRTKIFEKWINYLTATNTDHGLLINFGGERIEIKRKFREYKHKE